MSIIDLPLRVKVHPKREKWNKKSLEKKLDKLDQEREESLLKETANFDVDEEGRKLLAEDEFGREYIENPSDYTDAQYEGHLRE